LGPIDKTIELNYPLTTNNGLINCIALNNINFRNLTFRLGSYLGSGFSADIDNFEIALDYTPPAVTPAPVVFQEGQRGAVWEIGPDKTNISLFEETEDFVSVASGQAFNVALKKDGTVWTWTNTNKIPKQVRGESGIGFLTDIKEISAGGNYGMALRGDGTVLEWGQILDEPQNPISVKYGGVIMKDVIDIAVGRMHKLVLRSDGKVYGWGLNNDGQVGIGCFLYNCSFVSTPTQTKSIDNVKAISAGWGHSLALKNDGTVWGWGESTHLELGEKIQSINRDWGERPLPLQIVELKEIESISTKGFYNLAVSSSGEILEWGNFIRGVPTKIDGISNVSYVSAGPSGYSYGVQGHAIREDGTLWQLYINDIPPKQVPHLKDVIAVASGEQTPSLAVVNSAGDVLGDSTVAPFLDLPWDYENKRTIQSRKSYTFSEAALAINSYFDHQYPLLGRGRDLEESEEALNTIVPFLGFPKREKPEFWYSNHDGYDYGISAGVFDGDPVFPAASGSAIYEYDAAGGHTILVDHHNGYQTRYYHLQDGLTKTPREVDRSTIIGRVGSTGSHTTGPHIHIGLFQDKNNDGNFEDNEPDGATDPFGWQPFTDPSERDPDPWEEYTFSYTGQQRKGNKSNYLWKNKLPQLKQALSSSGGKFEMENHTVEFDADEALSGLKLDLHLDPQIKDSASLGAVGPGISVILKDKLGKIIKDLTKPILRITIKFEDGDLYRFKPGSLAIYSSDDMSSWEKEASVIDIVDKKVTIKIDHMTHFALMGERIDTISPTTSQQTTGEKGEQDWFRSNVELSLVAKDNEGGLGVDNTQYRIEGGDWKPYSEPLSFTDEGKHKISYYSVDKDNNVEDVKTYDFHIDKTSPSSTASGVAKIEYSLDGGDAYQNYESEIAISKEGDNELIYRSVDKAGNVEQAKSMTIKIDKTTPSTIAYIGGSHGEDNWYRSNVEIGLNGNDDTSGYTSYYSLDNGESYREIDDPIILSAEGTNRIYYYSVDKAGNKEEQKSIEINIDKTSPVVLITANPATLWPANGKMVNVKIGGKVDEENLFKTLFNITDEYNLIEPVLAGFDQTIKLEAKRNGNDRDGRMYSIVANAEDLAGNQGSAQVQIIVPHDQR
jgi:murein DD-endopeptidase MepM/ murein hydrolase activator NlpD